MVTSQPSSHGAIYRTFHNTFILQRASFSLSRYRSSLCVHGRVRVYVRVCICVCVTLMGWMSLSPCWTLTLFEGQASILCVTGNFMKCH